MGVTTQQQEHITIEGVIVVAGSLHAGRTELEGKRFERFLE